MSLGSGFPPEFRRAQILRQLRPGAVIKIRDRLDDQRVHEKRFVVVAVDDRVATCIINSRISQFLQNRAEMLRCQVTMRLAEHVFMDHDSFVDCSRVRVYSMADIVRELMDKPEWMLGTICSSMKNEMVAALKFAPTLPAEEVARLCDSLETAELA